MPANIKITVRGAKQTSGVLRKISTEFKNTAVPLDRSSKKYLNAISANYRDEGRTFGEAWAPLSAATIAIKTALKKQGKAIAIKKPLVRTGLMRRSFGFELAGLNFSRIFNTQTYAQIHQEGGAADFNGRKVTIPKRVLAAVDTARINMVGVTFENWIQELITKHKAGKR
ncbi:MAG: phage virion morphogenesis protein [Patescibacteria group bacterium]|nr:phage virion morphogenesis protein [Patescibacteria group bacterium]